MSERVKLVLVHVLQGGGLLFRRLVSEILDCGSLGFSFSGSYLSSLLKLLTFNSVNVYIGLGLRKSDVVVELDSDGLAGHTHARELSILLLLIFGLFDAVGVLLGLSSDIRCILNERLLLSVDFLLLSGSSRLRWGLVIFRIVLWELLTHELERRRGVVVEVTGHVLLAGLISVNGGVELQQVHAIESSLELSLVNGTGVSETPNAHGS